jgi:acyl-CoA reductase-like NAD-dependent aldehyde dehydrogenase
LASLIFPPGVIQALHGGDEIGPLLCDHSDIHMISFTGSIPTGKKIMAAASEALKRVVLELGGTPQIAFGAFLNSGQFCLASKRIFVHQDIYQEFL